MRLLGDKAYMANSKPPMNPIVRWLLIFAPIAAVLALVLGYWYFTTTAEENARIQTATAQAQREATEPCGD
jgi:hypothetical protein